MQQQLSFLSDNNGGPFSTKLKSDLQKAAQWAKISAIVALCSVVVVVVQTFIQGNIISTIIMEGGNIAIVMCLLYFGIYTKRGIETKDQAAFEKGLNNLRLYFKTLGIILIVVISLAALVVVASMLFGVKSFLGI